MEMWLNFIVSVLSGLAVCIPLVVRLVVAVKNVIQEKNWAELCKIAMQFMISAEGNFSNGADKKEWLWMLWLMRLRVLAIITTMKPRRRCLI